MKFTFAILLIAVAFLVIAQPFVAEAGKVGDVLHDIVSIFNLIMST